MCIVELIIKIAVLHRCQQNISYCYSYLSRSSGCSRVRETESFTQFDVKQIRFMLQKRSMPAFVAVLRFPKLLLCRFSTRFFDYSSTAQRICDVFPISCYL